MFTVNILHIPPYAPPIEGGSERFCFNLCKSLIKNGHNVRVFTSIKNSTKFDVVEGVPCYYFKNYRHMLLLNPLAFIYQKLSEGVDWADIVHVHSYIYFMSNQAALYRKKRKFPFVLHLHGGTSPISTKVYGRSPMIVKKIYDFTVGKWTVQAADAIMASSKDDADNAINRFGADPSRIIQIPNSIFVDDFYSAPENPPIVTFLARLVRLKGSHLIPDIIKRVHKERRDVQFWLVGDGYDRQYLEERLNGLPVCFWGAVPNSQVPGIFAKSSVSFLPSYTESCPLAILESMASQVPVVASNVGGIPEIIEDGVTGFLTETEDTKKMAERILFLLNNDKERRNMGYRGRKFVENTHSWKNTTKKVVHIYKKLLQTR